MENDKLDRLGPVMNDIGQQLADIVGGDPEGVFLYVEIGPGRVEASVFKDEGASVRYFDWEETDLSDLLFDAWYLEPEGKRWSAMEYDIKGGTLETAFKYPEEMDRAVDTGVRREALLRPVW